MQIEFGTPVFGVDGKRLGDVDGLVVNAGTKRASAILVDAGLFDRGKHMIGVSAITRSDQDGLHLDQPATTSEAVSQTLDSEEVSIAQRTEPPTEYIPAAGVGGRVYADAPAPSGEYPDESSFFELALGAYCFVGFVNYTTAEKYLVGPFLGLYAVGFTVVGFMSLAHYLRKNYFLPAATNIREA